MARTTIGFVTLANVAIRNGFLELGHWMSLRRQRVPAGLAGLPRLYRDLRGK
jgi:hypothetical protein